MGTAGHGWENVRGFTEGVKWRKGYNKVTGSGARLGSRRGGGGVGKGGGGEDMG